MSDAGNDEAIQALAAHLDPVATWISEVIGIFTYEQQRIPHVEEMQEIVAQVFGMDGYRLSYLITILVNSLIEQNLSVLEAQAEQQVLKSDSAFETFKFRTAK